jgi:hypothetical protein
MNGQWQQDPVSILQFSKEDIGVLFELDVVLRPVTMAQVTYSINRDSDVVAIQNPCSEPRYKIIFL